MRFNREQHEKAVKKFLRAAERKKKRPPAKIARSTKKNRRRPELNALQRSHMLEISRVIE